MHNSMAVSASTFSWHHSLCELMTLEKSSIGPRLEVATPLTRWKHAFSPCRNGRDFTRARIRRSKRTKRNQLASVTDEECEGKPSPPTTGSHRSYRIPREIRRGDSSRNEVPAIARFLTRRKLIPSEMPRSSWSCLSLRKKSIFFYGKKINSGKDDASNA